MTVIVAENTPDKVRGLLKRYMPSEPHGEEEEGFF